MGANKETQGSSSAPQPLRGSAIRNQLTQHLGYHDWHDCFMGEDINVVIGTVEVGR